MKHAIISLMATKKTDDSYPAQVILTAADRKLEDDLRLRVLHYRFPKIRTVGPTLIYRLGLRLLTKAGDSAVKHLIGELLDEGR